MSASLAPRHDLDAEAVVLSGCLLDPAGADEALCLLRPDHFYSPANRVVFGAISDLAEQGSGIDVVAVTSQLRAAGKLDQVGGSPYLAQLLDETPAVAHLAEHARTVLDWARVRRAALTFQQLLAETRGDVSDVGKWLQKCETLVYQATADYTTERESVGDYKRMAVDAYAAVGKAARGPGYSGLRTGFTALDDHIGGLEWGDLCFIACRPGEGKTSFAFQVAEHVAELGWGVIAFSLEMRLMKLMYRTFARRARIALSALKRGRLSNHEWSRLAEVVEEISRFPMIVDDGEQLTLAMLRSKLRRHQATLRKRHPKAKLGLVVVDYIQLMEGETGRESRENRNEVLTRISRGLKRIAKEFECVVTANSQLSRPLKGQKLRPPELHDLRDSGALEQDADLVLFIHPERVDDGKEERPNRQEPSEVDIIVAKGRDCGTGVHHCIFDGCYTRFREADDDQYGFVYTGAP
jgi:replicative DNA helicase